MVVLWALCMSTGYCKLGFVLIYIKIKIKTLSFKSQRNPDAK